jgi:hypothetical protein
MERGKEMEGSSRHGKGRSVKDYEHYFEEGMVK